MSRCKNQELPTFQECLVILKKAEENRKNCCDRLIQAKALEEDAWESGEFDKVCSDCASCGEGRD